MKSQQSLHNIGCQRTSKTRIPKKSNYDVSVSSKAYDSVYFHSYLSSDLIDFIYLFPNPPWSAATPMRIISDVC